MSKLNLAVIVLGSNIDPEENILKARQALMHNFVVLNESQPVKTKPVGFLDQPDFINATVLIETSLDRAQLREELRRIEDVMGRVRSDFKYDPRTIDLDIVVWNGKIIDQDFYEREFLKKAVLTVLPELKY